jgi:sec-independent protein translocase protein TatA
VWNGDLPGEGNEPDSTFFRVGRITYRLQSSKERIMLGLGTAELVIILVVVILLFGVGRISRVAGEMGKGIRAFKDGLAGDEEGTEEEVQEEQESA